jgi:hypothetical protein
MFLSLGKSCQDSVTIFQLASALFLLKEGEDGTDDPTLWCEATTLKKSKDHEQSGERKRVV